LDSDSEYFKNRIESLNFIQKLCITFKVILLRQTKNNVSGKNGTSWVEVIS